MHTHTHHRAHKERIHALYAPLLYFYYSAAMRTLIKVYHVKLQSRVQIRLVNCFCFTVTGGNIGYSTSMAMFWRSLWIDQQQRYSKQEVCMYISDHAARLV